MRKEALKVESISLIDSRSLAKQVLKPCWGWFHARINWALLPSLNRTGHAICWATTTILFWMASFGEMYKLCALLLHNFSEVVHQRIKQVLISSNWNNVVSHLTDHLIIAYLYIIILFSWIFSKCVLGRPFLHFLKGKFWHTVIPRYFSAKGQSPEMDENRNIETIGCKRCVSHIYCKI